MCLAVGVCVADCVQRQSELELQACRHWDSPSCHSRGPGQAPKDTAVEVQDIPVRVCTHACVRADLCWDLQQLTMRQGTVRYERACSPMNWGFALPESDLCHNPEISKGVAVDTAPSKPDPQDSLVGNIAVGDVCHVIIPSPTN